MRRNRTERHAIGDHNRFDGRELFGQGQRRGETIRDLQTRKLCQRVVAVPKGRRGDTPHGIRQPDLGSGRTRFHQGPRPGHGMIPARSAIGGSRRHGRRIVEHDDECRSGCTRHCRTRRDHRADDDDGNQGGQQEGQPPTQPVGTRMALAQHAIPDQAGGNDNRARRRLEPVQQCDDAHGRNQGKCGQIKRQRLHAHRNRPSSRNALSTNSSSGLCVEARR